jgi:hypothetical protein
MALSCFFSKSIGETHVSSFGRILATMMLSAVGPKTLSAMRTSEHQEEWFEPYRARASNGTSQVVDIEELQAVKLESEHQALIPIERTLMSPRGRGG